MKYFSLIVFSLAVSACCAEPIINLFSTAPTISYLFPTVIPDFSQTLANTIKPYVPGTETFENYITNLTSTISRAVRRANGQFSEVIGNLSTAIENEVRRSRGCYNDFIGNLTQSIQEIVLSANGSTFDVTGNLSSAIKQHIENLNSTETFIKVLRYVAFGFRQAAALLEGPVQQFFGAFVNIINHFMPQDIIGHFLESFDPPNTALLVDFENYLRVSNFTPYQTLYDSIQNIAGELNIVVSQYGNLTTNLLDMRHPLATHYDYLRGSNNSIELNQITSAAARNLAGRIAESSQIFLREFYALCAGLNPVLSRRVNESVARLSSCATNEITRLTNSIIVLQNEQSALRNNIDNTDLGLSAVSTAIGIAVDAMGIKGRFIACEAEQSRDILFTNLIPISNNRYLCTRSMI